MPSPTLPSPSSLTARIPAAYALSLLTLMLERGHEQDALLSGTRLTLDELKGQHTQIDAWQYAVLLVNAMRADPDHGLAYELGLRSQVTKHGFVGFGLISCATLREAIEFSERYFRARVPIDLPPYSRTSRMEVRSVNLENDGHEEESIHGAADHRVLEAGRVGLASQGCLPPRRVQ